MKWQTLLSTLLLCGVSTICSAQMYKWVDEQGDTHYSEIPPPKGDVTTVAPPPPPAKGQENRPKITKSMGGHWIPAFAGMTGNGVMPSVRE